VCSWLFIAHCPYLRHDTMVRTVAYFIISRKNNVIIYTQHSTTSRVLAG